MKLRSTPAAIALTVFMALLVPSIATLSPAYADQGARPAGWGAWMVSKMVQPLYGQTAASVGSSVLIEGGVTIGPGTGFVTGTSAMYSAGANKWTQSASMKTEREDQFSVRLSNGSILVGGGFDDSGSMLSSTEIFAPALKRWIPAAPMPKPAALQAAVLLPDGDVLAIGGVIAPLCASNLAWLYNPHTNTWKAAAHMLYARAGLAAVLLGNGHVLVAGGLTPWAEMYDPDNNTWKLAGRPGIRLSPALLSLGKNEALMAGGQTESLSCSSSAKVFSNNRWISIQPMSDARCAPLATALPDGSDVIGGGYGSDTWRSMQRLVPGHHSWSYFPALTIPRCAGTLTYVDHGILAAGGEFEGTEIGLSEFLSLRTPSR